MGSWGEKKMVRCVRTARDDFLSQSVPVVQFDINTALSRDSVVTSVQWFNTTWVTAKEESDWGLLPIKKLQASPVLRSYLGPCHKQVKILHRRRKKSRQEICVKGNDAFRAGWHGVAKNICLVKEQKKTRGVRVVCLRVRMREFHFGALKRVFGTYF